MLRITSGDTCSPHGGYTLNLAERITALPLYDAAALDLKDERGQVSP